MVSVRGQFLQSFNYFLLFFLTLWIIILDVEITIQGTPVNFFLLCFLTAFSSGFPLGPGSIQMLRLLGEDKKDQAVRLATGLSLSGAGWASIAYAGFVPLFKVTAMKRLFLIVSSTLMVLLGLREFLSRSPLNDNRIELISFGKKSENFFSPLIKGLLFGFAFPLSLFSWTLAINFINTLSHRSVGGELSILPLFFVTVFCGYFLYLLLLKKLFSTSWLNFLTYKFYRSRKLNGSIFLIMAGLLIVLTLSEIFFARS